MKPLIPIIIIVVAILIIILVLVNLPADEYISKNPDECARIKFFCTDGKEPFFDNIGCGCRDQERNFCTQRQDACIEIYQPVCGWSGPEIQCFAFPCANNYPNSCFACMDNTVAYWTEGECPNS